ncbi:MAG: hypothetical protein J6B16_03740, partial [Clostridia bacterium]|nr:hypothetical protein [Clostridia bacterium]
LSEVCKSHPRFIENFGAIKEITLSLSCPESVRLLYDEDLSFVERLDDTLPVLNEIDTKIFNYLNESRADLFNFIFDKNLNLSEILGGIINLKDILQEEIDDATFIKIEYEKADEFRFNIDLVQDIIKTLSKCTFTRKNIKNTITKITNLIFTDNFINELNDYLNTTPHKNFIIKILAIYIFRFYLTAVYDGKILDKINLCLYSILYIICAFYVESTLDDNTYNYLNIVKEYSREIFHCDKNVKYIIKTINKKNLI